MKYFVVLFSCESERMLRREKQRLREFTMPRRRKSRKKIFFPRTMSTNKRKKKKTDRLGVNNISEKKFYRRMMKQTFFFLALRCCLPIDIRKKEKQRLMTSDFTGNEQSIENLLDYSSLLFLTINTSWSSLVVEFLRKKNSIKQGKNSNNFFHRIKIFGDVSWHVCSRKRTLVDKKYSICVRFSTTYERSTQINIKS